MWKGNRNRFSKSVRDKQKIIIIKSFCRNINNLQTTNVRGEALFGWKQNDGVGVGVG